MEEKINALIGNKEFEEKIALTETTEEIIGVFADYGVVVTEEDLESALVQAKSGSDELNEEDLGNVSGGIVAGCVALGGLLIKLGDKLGTWKWWRKKLGL